MLTGPGTVPDDLLDPGMFGRVLHHQPACVTEPLADSASKDTTDKHIIIIIQIILGDILLK